MSTPRSFLIGIDANENYPPTFPKVIRVTSHINAPPTLISLRARVTRLSAPTRKRNPYNWGDYCALDYKQDGRMIVGIDKKGSPHELMQNLGGTSKERARFLRSLDLFSASVIHPYIWLDMGWTDLWTRAPAFARRSPVKFDPTPAFDALFHELISRNIRLIGPTHASTTQQRLYAGQYIAHLLYAHCHPRSATPSAFSPTLAPALTALTAH